MKLNTILNESPNDKMMYREEMKDVVKSIMTVWMRAQHLDISYEMFEKDLDNQIKGAKQDLRGATQQDGWFGDPNHDPRNEQEEWNPRNTLDPHK